MSRFKITSFVIGSVMIASTVNAQGAPAFESLDKNSDGQISIQEATPHDDLFVAFKQLDTNKDGALSRAEFAQFKK
jgi:Ca2+-binding EF-hand superfamily protein